MLLPNFITLLAICAGLTAIRLSTEGRMELAVAAIVFAAVLDGIDGRVARMIKGQSKFGAELDKASEDNERNSLVIGTPQGQIGVVQIAGLVARRIVCFAREGQAIGAGERFGLIRFGSRLDVYLPDGVKALVAEGQTAVAGETVLADLGGNEQGRTFRAD